MKKIENPWKIISSKVVYESKFLKVMEDRVVSSDGKEGIHNLIMGGPANNEGVCIAAVNDDWEIFLVKQYRYAYGGYTLELIGGGIEKGDTPLRAAKKELGEEAGVTASEWLEYGAAYPATEMMASKIHLFLARDLHPSPETLHQENNMSVVKVPLKEAKAMVMRGEIPLASAALGILMVGNIIEI